MVLLFTWNYLCWVFTACCLSLLHWHVRRNTHLKENKEANKRLMSEFEGFFFLCRDGLVLTAVLINQSFVCDGCTLSMFMLFSAGCSIYPFFLSQFTGSFGDQSCLPYHHTPGCGPAQLWWTRSDMLQLWPVMVFSGRVGNKSYHEKSINKLTWKRYIFIYWNWITLFNLKFQKYCHQVLANYLEKYSKPTITSQKTQDTAPTLSFTRSMLGLTKMKALLYNK